ncbi:MAG: hypothetical protein N3B12_01215 [Armatimonadetes bacterium]|nr:hypothetical protein [Armatimonadota bacterium]
MRTFAAIIILTCIGECATFASDPPKLNIEARNTSIKDVVDELSRQSGVAIVVDPKVQATVSLSLKNSELTQALDALAKLNKLIWKKLQIAKPADETVKLDDIKSAIATLASIPVIGLVVENPEAKATSIFAQNLPSSPDTSNIKLPDNYGWTTVYVILASEPKDTKTVANTTALIGDPKERTLQIASLNPEARRQTFAAEIAAQMSLAPEVRRQILADRLLAIFGLDAEYRNQYREDMREAFRLARDENPEIDFGRRGSDRRGRAERDANSD